MNSNKLSILLILILSFYSVITDAQLVNMNKKDSVAIDSMNQLLIIAAEECNSDEVIKLLINGADVNSKTAEGITPLMYASQNGCTDVVKILVHNGADVNTIPDDGSTALIAAARFNHSDIVDYLIQNKATVDKKDNDSITALMYAVAYGYYITSDMLLFYGADVNASAKDGSCPLLIASFNGNKDIAEMLLTKSADINKTDNNGWTALHYAVYNNNFDVIKLLIEKGVPVNKQNNEGYTAFAYACQTGNFEIADYLLKHGADATVKTNKDISPYEIALYLNNSGIIKTLRKNGVKSGVKPLFNNIKISPVDITFNHQDFMYGGKAGIVDIKHNIGFNIGYNTRLWANRIIVPLTDNFYYQFWEKRSLLSLTAEKLFEINSGNDFQHGVFIEAKGLYTFGKYEASQVKPNDKILFAPCLGYTIFNNYAGAKISYEYLDFKVTDKTPHRLNFSLFFFIKIKKYNLSQKYIYWL